MCKHIVLRYLKRRLATQKRFLESEKVCGIDQIFNGKAMKDWMAEARILELESLIDYVEEFYEKRKCLKK
ncbi:MAG: hypothetical protein ACRCTJ_01135 [Brevinema sp.]